jgi:hypothetical protein
MILIQAAGVIWSFQNPIIIDEAEISELTVRAAEYQFCILSQY